MYDVRPRHRSQLFAVEARQWRTYPDSTSAALRTGHLRRFACPDPTDSVAQTLYGESSKPMTSLLWLVRLAKRDLRADEPEPQTVLTLVSSLLVIWN